MGCMERFRSNVGIVEASCLVCDETLQNVPALSNPVLDPVEQTRTEILARPPFSGMGQTVPCWYAVLLTTAW
jgi:hypothetical protein